MIIDGQLIDWTEADRIDALAPVSGYAVYGKFDTDRYLIALQSAVQIGPNTTIWLNTDLNAATGYQVFGNAVGAEYEVVFDSNRVPQLYQLDAVTGNAILVSGVDIQFAFSPDSTVVELAIPQNGIAGAA